MVRNSNEFLPDPGFQNWYLLQYLHTTLANAAIHLIPKGGERLVSGRYGQT